SDPATTNRLINPTPVRYTTLFRSLHTLGIQVNLRAITDTVAEVYALPPTRLWKAMGEELNELIVTIEFDAEARTMIKHQLFEAPDWKSTRLNSSHVKISYAIFCLK